MCSNTHVLSYKAGGSGGDLAQFFLMVFFNATLSKGIYFALFLFCLLNKDLTSIFL
jgi:hypothetical protein